MLLVVLAPLIIPTEVLIVPLFSMYRALGLINSLPNVALTNVVASVSFATIILAGYFRTISQDVIDAARVDGADRVAVLLRIVIPLLAPGSWSLAHSSRCSHGMTSPGHWCSSSDRSHSRSNLP